MAITQKRLQQIIQEEVARLLREADEGENQSPAETALSALQSAQYDNTVAARMNKIEADAAMSKADALESELAGLAETLGLEDKNPRAQAEELRKLAEGLNRSAEEAETKASEAAAALEQVAGVLGAVTSKVATGGEEAAEEEPAGEAPEEAPIQERWNKLAFGRKLL